MPSKYKTKISSLIILLSIAFSSITPFFNVRASVEDDFNYYNKYPLHEKYEKKKKYDKYQKAKDKYGFKDASQREKYKKAYEKYRLFKKSPSKYPQYAVLLKEYRKYKNYKEEVVPLKKYAGYKNYDKKEYERYKGYGSSQYKDGYNRYKAFMGDLSNVTSNRGPEISVGLWSYDTGDIQLSANAFSISANKIFNVTDCASEIKGEIPIGVDARVTYVDASGGTLSVKSSDDTSILATPVVGNICFQAKDGNSEDMIFDVNRPDINPDTNDQNYDQYRGKIKIKYSNSSDNQALLDDAVRIWVINTLPLEHYLWGFGEIGGGVDEHSKAMLVAARTYAKWHMQPGVSDWTEEGFTLLSDSNSQIYWGYDYEIGHSSIGDLARTTNGIIMRDQNGDIVVAAFCSWSDGRTRKHGDGHWGRTYRESTPGDFTDGFPELRSVDDPYGKHPTLDGPALAAAGNHMVGMIANGSLVLARDHNWSYTAILSHYYYGISIVKEY